LKADRLKGSFCRIKIENDVLGFWRKFRMFAWKTRNGKKEKFGENSQDFSLSRLRLK
jgi:hypothetical protein